MTKSISINCPIALYLHLSLSACSENWDLYTTKLRSSEMEQLFLNGSHYRLTKKTSVVDILRLLYMSLKRH
ncbi:hypothetical protein F5Y08DRAFT_308328 [Xylaria arbuscula]|nr:hypothetical protein F5Y08DRAFT_308328 [Xylaria arbuscula]